MQDPGTMIPRQDPGTINPHAGSRDHDPCPWSKLGHVRGPYPSGIKSPQSQTSFWGPGPIFGGSCGPWRPKADSLGIWRRSPQEFHLLWLFGLWVAWVPLKSSLLCPSMCPCLQLGAFACKSLLQLFIADRGGCATNCC